MWVRVKIESWVFISAYGPGSEKSEEEKEEFWNEFFFYPVAWGFRIQPTFSLVRVVRGDLSWDINCLIPPAHCMLDLFACSEAYEFGQLGTGLSWFR